ncbi:ABC transporter permease [Bacillus sp. OK048]|uniref:ABC transporter permease n=1 Tax=Bacillus sp. OK048 TaxID=1882761 RepID=UPI000882D033|nr:ABC transporter permease [Bacillus sp. OK048]SDN57493.1 putative ABC transport system permease protein [Bacillus sp. OK048]
MNKTMFLRLASSNLRRNRSMLLPYYMSCLIVIALLCVVNALVEAPGLKNISGGNFTIDVMKLGQRLFALMAVLFLYYTNIFIMRRRQKELGLYHILGLEKRHIYKVMKYENLISSTAVIFIGLLLGMALNPIMFFVLSKIIGQATIFSVAVPPIALLKTGLLFAVLFFILHRYNIRQVRRANPLELLHASSFGQKEPKANTILVILGAGILAVGYFLALTATNPNENFTRIIAAILCVAAATYLLFIAVSIAVLKFLKSQDNIYYRSKNFNLISGMLYRMKQNGVGLANICILCTATLFVMTTTVSLYLGIENVIQNSFNHEVYISENGTNHDALQNFLAETSERYSVSLENETLYSGSKTKEDLDQNGTEEFVFLMPLKDYNRLTARNVELKENEVLVFSGDEKTGDTVNLYGNLINVKEQLGDFPIKNNFGHIYGNRWWYLVTSNDSELTQDYDTIEGFAEFYLEFDLEGAEVDKKAFEYALYEWDEQHGQRGVEAKAIERDNSLVRFGGLLFLGILISVVLFAQTALCVFYKQVSEGYDDKKRFEILGKVGMSQKEIRQTIRKQTLIVFFSPLAVAVLHMLVALSMIANLLKIAFLDSPVVIAISGLSCIVIFLLVYGVVFVLTEGAYKKIVYPNKK